MLGTQGGGQWPPHWGSGISQGQPATLGAKPQEAAFPVITCADTWHWKAQLSAQRPHITGPPSFIGKECCLRNLRAAGGRGSEFTGSHQGALLKGMSSGLSFQVFQLDGPSSSLSTPQWGRTNHSCLSRLLKRDYTIQGSGCKPKSSRGEANCSAATYWLRDLINSTSLGLIILIEMG